MTVTGDREDSTLGRGGDAEVHLRNAAVHTFAEGLIVRSTAHMDIDEARAVAERLAEERG